MATFHLQVVSMDGLIYEGSVQKIMLRTIDGDVAILARHTNYCTAIGMGTAHILLEDNSEKTAACIGGMLSVMDGECHVLATTWEWEEDIDRERAEAAKDRAQDKLNETTISDREYKIFKAKLQRALVRLSVKG